MKRHKEFAIDWLFSPLRLFGGFICVDFHLGCAGCLYCLNRREGRLAEILDRNVQIDYSSLGIGTKEIFTLVSSCWSFSQAKLPIRLGHSTDWRYQVEQTQEFLSFLPDDYPAVVLTRFPLSKEQCDSIRENKNVLCHISLAPPLSGEKVHVDYDELILSAANLPRDQIFFMCRPLIGNNKVENERLIKSLPDGAAVGFHGLSLDNIADVTTYASFTANDERVLRDLALQRSLRVYDYFGCLLWEKLKVPFWKFPSAVKKDDGHCHSCDNFHLCEKAVIIREDDVAFLLKKMELSFESIKIEKERITIVSKEATARCEEVFLSQMLKKEVNISSVARSLLGGVQQMEETIAARWQNTGFAPIDRMEDISQKIAELI